MGPDRTKIRIKRKLRRKENAKVEAKSAQNENEGMLNTRERIK